MGKLIDFPVPIVFTPGHILIINYNKEACKTFNKYCQKVGCECVGDFVNEALLYYIAAMNNVMDGNEIYIHDIKGKNFRSFLPPGLERLINKR